LQNKVAKEIFLVMVKNQMQIKLKKYSLPFRKVNNSISTNLEEIEIFKAITLQF
jgi:hypothetical protein